MTRTPQEVLAHRSQALGAADLASCETRPARCSSMGAWRTAQVNPLDQWLAIGADLAAGPILSGRSTR